MLNARTVALIAAAMACCSAAARAADAFAAEPTPGPLSLPEPSAIVLFVAALVGLARFGRRRP